jgi:hypothetical protein
MSYDAVKGIEVPTEPPPPTPTRLKVLLAHHTGRQPEYYSNANWQALLEVTEEKRAMVVANAHIDVSFLQMMGCKNPDQIRLCGIDHIAFELDSVLLDQLAARFPMSEIKKAYLRNSSDAVMLAGSRAAERMGVELKELLTHCRAQRIQSHACIEQSLEVWKGVCEQRRSSIRLASPLASVSGRLLAECCVHLPSISNWKLELFRDIDVSGLTHAEQVSIGIPLLAL